ncbi:pullulanase-type alpha-1,6-glucosidase [Egicoccus sp. AB-alg2]|uniref:pullulanase-type alpha-1,6-glucosidase n=1 Tax=Egicoccus sp. AB-alg2 TaxID=3242693 RepID=UPI00359D3CB9
MRRLWSCLLACVLLLSLVPAAGAEPAAPETADTIDASADGAPAWARHASIYQVFVDRFRDGDPANPDVDTSLDFSGALKDWMGGDLAGVREGLDHIQDLGFDTIWLGPVYDNKYFHGYHPTDFLQVDPNFGDVAALTALVDEVHDRGLRIVYDFVPNHTSDEHPWFQDVLARCQDSPWFDHYRFETCDADTGTYEYATFFGIDELPELDLLAPDTPASRYLLDEVVPFYFDEVGFDGFRIDHAKGFGSVDSEGTDDNQAFLAALRDRVAAMEGEKFLFGEIWSPRNAIAGYQDVLDGAVNFPLHDAFVSTMAGNASLANLDAAVRADLDAYGDGFVTPSFLDNHDVQRFVFRAGNDDTARERLKLALTAQFTLPGATIVYQGTEIGMGQTANTEAAGGGWVDRWYREPMPWPDAAWAHAGSEGFVLQERREDVAARVQALNALRDEQPALAAGEYRTVHAAGDLYAFERVHDDGRLLTVVNRGDARTLDLADLYGAEVPDGVALDALLGEGTTTSGDGTLTLDLTAVSAEVFAVDGDLPAAPGPDDTPPADVPDLVVLPGAFQSELGCTGDWQPDCEATALTYDATGDVWRGSFDLPAGRWEYKVAIDGSWTVNYGQGGQPDGPNLVLELAEPTTVDFVFSHRTGWVANSVQHVFATVPGEFQTEAGCPGDWQPECFRTWLQDVDGDGTYTYTSPGLPAGSYLFKVALDGGWDVNYGQGGIRNGADLSATVADGERIRVHFTPPTGDGDAGLSYEVVEGTDPVDPSPGVQRDHAVVHYQRDAGDEAEWGLHLWGDIDVSEQREWPDHKRFTGETDYGRFTWVKLAPGAEEVGMVVAKGDQKDPDADLVFDPRRTPEVWVRQGDATLHTSQAAAQGFVTIRYELADGDDGSGLGLHLWGDGLAEGAGTDWGSPRPMDGSDDYGAYWQVPVGDVDAPVGFIVRRGQDKELEPDLFLTPSQTPTAWLRAGDATVHASRGAALDLAVLHYHRPDGDYGDPASDDYNDFWGLHTWGGAADPGWTTPRKPVAQDGFGLVFEVPLDAGAESLNYILHRGDTKDLPQDQTLDLQRFGHEVWILSGVEEYLLPVVTAGTTGSTNLRQQRAHFVTSGLIAWPFDTPAGATYHLHHAAEGGLEVGDDGVTGEHVELTVVAGGLPAEITQRDGFRHLAGRAALAVPDDVDLDAWLTGQLAVSATDADGRLVAATSLQLPGVLDERYATDAELGVVWDGDTPSLHLWAPTAKRVAVHRFADSGSAEPVEVVEMTRDGGVWSLAADASWDRDFYLYEVEVFVPETGRVETNLVTDPYSFSLATDSTRTQVVRLSDEDLAPTGWQQLDKPAFAGQRDLTVYELHVRDFSIADETVPEKHRGKYTAFTLDDTDGVNHLRALADAGLSHLHLLPTFDLATIPEDPDDRVEPDIDWDGDPASEHPQAAQQAVKDRDGFNWGYDPFHYTTPEGSYATDPDGVQRIVEYRQMVAALNDLGLRVVNDVVYNHTHAAGQDSRGVLDKIVPGYYHRLSDTGVIETSTCCPNTATEHAMMEKLTIDSVLTWASEYKVDGFRFDLMGHHPKAQMVRLREALDGLTLEEHGVDGSTIVLYGEGWNFGEVENDARFVQATQANLAGTGIGTFNDRLRDGARGGNPFGGLREQGFVTGLAVDANGTNQGSPAQQATRARHLADLVRIGLAGNLADYAFEASDGTVKAGRELDYGGSPAGYAATPTDNVVYVSKHDNETLFDAIQYKLPTDAPMAERVRAQNLGLSVVALAQGTPFFHAGSDLLRSKSLDRDSYNSGDWFNRLDWSRQTNNWGVGLPPAEKNRDNWDVMRPLLRGLPAPQTADLDRNADHFRELLAIRASSELFRLPDAGAVQEQLRFHDTGADATLGVIAMSLTGGQDAYEDLVVVFNGSTEDYVLDDAQITSGEWRLHPVQAASGDPVVRTSGYDAAAHTFTVPARTTAVFVIGEDPVGPPPVTCPDRPGDGDGQGCPPPHAGEPGRPPHAGEPGRPPHAGQPGRPPHAGEPGRPPHAGGPTTGR